MKKKYLHGKNTTVQDERMDRICCNALISHEL